MAQLTRSRLARMAGLKILPPTLRGASHGGAAGKGQTIMPTSHRSATRFPGTRPLGRRQEAKRRGGTHRRAT